MPAELLKSFLCFNDSKNLYKTNEKIGLAVSGGLDSVVLFHLFYQLKNAWNLKLIVLHFDHRLRHDSKHDADFVEYMCREKNIPFDRGEEDVAAFAKKQKISIEMAARDCRYAFFQQMLEKHQLDKIATGHNANDQAETVLFHIMRGAGLDGVSGIPVKRHPFIRPLLFAQRDDLHHYAMQHNLNWREDHSNRDESFTRNKIRHTLLPLMRDHFNPQIVTALNRLGVSAQENRDIVQHAGRDAFHACVTQTDDGKFVLEIDHFLTYLKSLQRLVLQHVFNEMRRQPELTYNKLEGVLAFLQKQQGGATFSLSDDIQLIMNGRHAVIQIMDGEQQPYEVHGHSPGTIELWNDLFLEILPWTEPLRFLRKKRNIEFVDADKLTSTIHVRSFQYADWFYPVNGAGRKKLADFFIDEKIPFSQRRTIPIVESDGQIVWVVGLRLDDRFKITDKTKRIYKLVVGRRGK